jgi:alpha-L-fucosidase 2
MSRYTRREFIATASAAGASTFARRLSIAEDATSSRSASFNNLILRYDKPAEKWINALPLGNGRLGAMMYGGGDHGEYDKELLQLNEDTLRSGMPRDGLPQSILSTSRHTSTIRRTASGLRPDNSDPRG